MEAVMGRLWYVGVIPMCAVVAVIVIIVPAERRRVKANQELSELRQQLAAEQALTVELRAGLVECREELEDKAAVKSLSDWAKERGFEHFP